MQTLSLLARVFYLIRSQDVELAEDFIRRCPEANSVTELNSFFHLLLTQYPFDTQPQRVALTDCDQFEHWAPSFVGSVLPVLRRERFPECTHTRVPAMYTDHLQQAAAV